MNIRYIVMLMACFLVTKSYGMGLQRKEQKAISLRRMCLENALLGVGLGLASQEFSVSCGSTGIPRLHILPVLFVLPSTYHWLKDSRGYDVGLPTDIGTDEQMLTGISHVAGYVAGVGASALCRYYLFLQQVIRESGAAE